MSDYMVMPETKHCIYAGSLALAIKYARFICSKYAEHVQIVSVFKSGPAKDKEKQIVLEYRFNTNTNKVYIYKQQ